MPSPLKAMLLSVPLIAAGTLGGADYSFQPVPFTAVRLTAGFWKDRQETNRRVTIPFALAQCEESGRMKNFDLAAEVMRRRAAGESSYQVTPPTLYPFDDSDAFKALEAAAFALSMGADPALERQLDGWIARIAAAQEPDGYLYTFRTMHPDTPGHKWIGAKRWEKDPDLSHELYNLGHLYEAGVAHYQATGKRTLLDPCLRSAELLWRDFGDGRLRIAPGHEIVETGLVKLYRVTGDERWLKLAQVFLDARGPGGPAYNQQQQLVVDQREAVGHAVRANYLYSGMADVAALTGDTRYRAAIEAIWANVVGRKLYLTGGAGALARGEAYGADYELPHDGYNETCAALALMTWNHRMFLLSGEARYMDVFERTAYNGFISGVSLAGDRFFYPNPLAYDGAAKNNHGFAGRAPWFGCACCPPNLARVLASLGGYFYVVRGDSLYVNLYGAGEGRMEVGGTMVGVTQATDYPWSGGIRLTVAPAHPLRMTLKLRLPGWAQGRPVPSDLYTYVEPSVAGWRLQVGGRKVDAMPGADGYLSVEREWRAGDVVEIDLAMPVHRVHGNPKITANKGMVAFERGPMVYCVEGGADQPQAGLIVVGAGTKASVADWIDAPGGMKALRIEGAGLARCSAIPYFAWNNRGLAPMQVWLAESAPVR